jgi:SAM-dependent methyltransferase
MAELPSDCVYWRQSRSMDDTEMTVIAEQILAAFCKDPRHARDDISHAPSDPLKELEREFPDLNFFVTGKDVLDFGCGLGNQARAIAERFNARVTGLDTHAGKLSAAREHHGERVRFIERLDGEKFDVVVSQDAMEHFGNPAAALASMAGALKPGGRILLTFGPTWYAPYGAHMNFFCPIPWLPLCFSEKTVMAVRARYRDDGATRYEQVESGLNKMSLHKFERLAATSGLKPERLNYTGVKKLNFLTKIPVVRELTTVIVTGILTPG